MARSSLAINKGIPGPLNRIYKGLLYLVVEIDSYDTFRKAIAEEGKEQYFKTKTNVCRWQRENLMVLIIQLIINSTHTNLVRHHHNRLFCLHRISPPCFVNTKIYPEWESNPQPQPQSKTCLSICYLR